MKKKGLFFVLFFLNLVANAQTAREVDSIVKGYPKSYSSTDRLVAKITTDFKTEYGRARAVYAWIGMNISYDLEQSRNLKPLQYQAGQEEQVNERIIKQVLTSRKAVCGGYSRLFSKLALAAGLESERIIGYSKTSGEDIGKPLTDPDHAWNAVKFGGAWHLIDVTWGAGFYNSTAGKMQKSFTGIYFDMPPELFFLNHHPEDSMWQNTKISKEDFMALPAFHLEENQPTISEPRTGRIIVGKNQKITFRIKGISPETPLFYTTKSEFTQEVSNKKTSGNSVEFELEIDQDFDKYLTLFADNKPLVTYKILFRN